MGFSEGKIKRAIESCPDAKTLEQVMEWLIAHEEELNSTEPQTATGNAAKVAKVETNSSMSVASGSTTDKTTDRSQRGEANETAANMAERKKITVEEAQRIITERQAKRAEEERKKEIEDEKKRRVAGQKMAETRSELQDQERIRLAQQIRREKLEQEEHRKKVLEQIARDREAMKLRNSRSTTEPNSSSSSSSTPSSSAIKTQPRAPSTECKIALRFPDGSSLVHKFSPNEQLAAVKLFVQMEKRAETSEIEFIAPPNKKLNSSQMEETLESLGLCPASRLEVVYKTAAWSDLD